MINNLITVGVLMAVPFAPSRQPEKETQQRQEIIAVLPEDIKAEDVSEDVSEDEFLKLV